VGSERIISISFEDMDNDHLNILKLRKILSLDSDPKSNVDGIWLMNALEFLMDISDSMHKYL
jgi:hypothetical protein